MSRASGFAAGSSSVGATRRKARPRSRCCERYAKTWNATIVISPTTITATQSQRFSRWPTVDEIVGHGIASLIDDESAASTSSSRTRKMIGSQNQ